MRKRERDMAMIKESDPRHQMTALPKLSQALDNAGNLYYQLVGESIFAQFIVDERTCGFCHAKLSDKMRRLRHEWYCHIRELFPTE